MKKILLSLLLLVSSLAHAEYRIVVTDAPGGGSSVWTTAVVKQLNKFTDEPIVLEHIPGARNIPGVNKFHNELRFNNKYLLATVGSNATNLFMEKVDYNFKDYDAIGGENLDMIVGRNVKFDYSQKVVWGNTAGLVDSTGMALMLCGNLPSMDAYLQCWKEKAVWVGGVSSAEQKMMFLRGEFNVTRDSPASWTKNYSDNKDVTVWYVNGIYDFKQKKQVANPNFPTDYFLPNAFKLKWGSYPKGEMWETYKLLVGVNNALQKTIWINKGNPNTTKLRDALNKMLADKDAMTELNKELGGSYGWIVGEDMDKVATDLYKGVTDKQLKNIVTWYSGALNTQSIYKPEMVSK